MSYGLKAWLNRGAAVCAVTILLFAGVWLATRGLGQGASLAGWEILAGLAGVAGLAMGLALPALLRAGRRWSVARQGRPWLGLASRHRSFLGVFLDMPDPMCIATMDRGRFLAVNPAFERVVGYSHRETYGKLAKEFSLWEPPESRIVLARAVKASGSVPFFRTGFRSRDGSVFECVVSASATIFDDEDCMILTVHDISQLVTAQRTIQENEQRLRLITDNVVDMIERLSPEGIVLFASEAARELTGFDPDEIVGRNIADFLHDDDRDSMVSFLESVVGAGEAGYVARLIKNDGSVAWIETRGRAVVDSAGTVTEIISVSHDVTGRRRTEQREQARLRVHETLSRGRDLPSVLNLVADFAALIRPDMVGCVFQLDGTRTKLIAGSQALIPAATPLKAKALAAALISPFSPLGAAVLRHKRRVVVADMGAEAEQWPEFEPILTETGYVSVWADPIFDSRNTLIGGLCLLGRKDAKMTPYDGTLLNEASCLAALAIEQSRVEEELKMTATIYGNIQEGIMVADANHKIISVNPAFTALTGYAPDEIIGQIHEFLVCDTDAVASLAAMEDQLRIDGTWSGELWTRKKDGDLFLDRVTVTPVIDPLGVSTRYISIHMDITEQKHAEERAWKQANFDALTDLPNRRLFRDRLSQEIARVKRLNDTLALLFIDLDKFKEVNDTLGHEWGDHLLIDAAHRITQCVRQSDTVARLGGDEFTVILPGLSESRRTDQVAQAIVDELRKPFTLNGHTVHISASVGITLFPADADDIDELIRNADQAMYVTKNLGRNQFSYFTQSMQTAAKERHHLNRDLRLALDQGQFEVYFQPIIDMHTSKIVKAEALVRWNHPQLGMVGPDRFIPVAEENGLIIEIGDWVFRETARVAKSVNFRRAAEDQIRLSVNVSPRQFYAKANHKEWLAHLLRIDLDPSAIGIEITENLLLADHKDVAAQLDAFREAGVRISLDDFGKGYSSLSYLKKFPIDYLKIDRDFVRDLVEDSNDRAISEAIIVMAHRLGIRVVAEGIETIGQFTALQESDCDEGQGYLFSKPVPAADFLNLLL